MFTLNMVSTDAQSTGGFARTVALSLEQPVAHVLEGEHPSRSARARIEVLGGKGLAAFSHP